MWQWIKNKHVSLPFVLLANEILKEIFFPGKSVFQDADIQQTVPSFCKEIYNAWYTRSFIMYFTLQTDMRTPSGKIALEKINTIWLFELVIYITETK